MLSNEELGRRNATRDGMHMLHLDRARKELTGASGLESQDGKSLTNSSSVGAGCYTVMFIRYVCMYMYMIYIHIYIYIYR